MELITLRDATDNDEKFVNTLTKLVMCEYVSETWNEIKDQEYYYELNKFNRLSTKIIQYSGIDIGRISITQSKKIIKLDNIHLSPEYQGKGIASNLIKILLRDSRLPVELVVLKNNPAKELYQRLGFKKYEVTDFRWKMRTIPPQNVRGSLFTSCIAKEVSVVGEEMFPDLKDAEINAISNSLEHVIEASFNSIKGIFLLTGGGCVALLTLLAAIIQSKNTQFAIEDLILSLVVMSAGVASISISHICRYQSRLYYLRAGAPLFPYGRNNLSDRIDKEEIEQGNRYYRVTQFLIFTALSCFMSSVYICYLALN